MFGFSFSQRIFVAGLLTALLVSGDVLAQRGGRDRGGGDGGRSSSRGGGGGEGRSFSRGGGESRSFSRGDFGGSSRSSSRSFRSSPSRSFNESSPSRSFGGSRSTESSSRPSRTFSVPPRSSVDGGQTSRSYQRGPSSADAARRSFNRGPSESPQVTRRFEQGDANRFRGESGDVRSFNRREYVAGRPTNDEVREFLQMRRDRSSNQPDNQPGRTNLGESRVDGEFRRGAGDRPSTKVPTDSARAQNFRNRVNESRNEGDRSWSRRFGDGNVNRGDNLRDSDNQNFRSRDFGDRGFVDSKYQTWKKGSWHSDGDRRGDNRDWSGRWKDGDRFVAADRIRKNWDRDWDHDDLPFHGGWKSRRWYGDHNHWNNWGYWNNWAHFHHRPWYWWSWATAPLLTSWFNFGWNTPYYWDYGPGEYIYCYDDVVYVNGRWFQPAPIYYENAVALAESAPNWTPEQAKQVEWLPLGVFAIARDGVPDKNLLIQLAVTNEGVIGGTVTNKLTGASFPVEGKVDKESQRAVWNYTDDKNVRIVMETSVYNLTQPEATGLVHYGPDNIQVVELVRLDQPEGDSAPAATTPAAPATGELPAP